MSSFHSSSALPGTSTSPVSPTQAVFPTITQDINTIHQRRLVTITEGITTNPKIISSWSVAFFMQHMATISVNHLAGLKIWEPAVNGLVLKWITLQAAMHKGLIGLLKRTGNASVRVYIGPRIDTLTTS
jgi:hypothetical protein